MLKTALFYAGFFLIFILFSEEFARGIKYFRELLERRPRLKALVYPLALLLAGGGLLLVGSSLFSLLGLKFSYE